MSKDRLTPCKKYICEGECTKGKKAEHKGLCQTCKSYEPRARIKHENRKKIELNKIRDKEWRNGD